MGKLVYGIEGLDRLGKSTLIEGIRNALGYYEVIHFSKPQRLAAYAETAGPCFDWRGAEIPASSLPAYHYQRESFRNSMLLAMSGARVIFDRWHIGEAVYSPLYRGYDGDFVFTFERTHGLDESGDIRLVLLTEDIAAASHFIDDGDSLGPVAKRAEEQQLFIDAFNKSIIRDKRMVCVTDPATGAFKSKERILAEVLE
jgi:thymidylate kinase